MKNLYSTAINLFLLFSLLTLLGCNAQPTEAPTVDPMVIATTVSAAKTNSVQTVDVGLTQAATATQLPTNTPQPTDIPSYTPVPPTLIPTLVSTVIPTQGAFQCSITSLNPKSGMNLANGTSFDLAVTLANTGSEKWSKDNVDFKYLNGAKFQTKVDSIDLPADVSPGNSINLVIDMTAKTGTGVQNATWELVNSTTPFCTVNIHVYVN